MSACGEVVVRRVRPNQGYSIWAAQLPPERVQMRCGVRVPRAQDRQTDWHRTKCKERWDETAMGAQNKHTVVNKEISPKIVIRIRAFRLTTQQRTPPHQKEDPTHLHIY
jgi:hypothetical protein